MFKVHKELITSLNLSITTEYGVLGKNDTSAAIDDLQSTFKCCGAEGFEDWRKSIWWRPEIRHNNKVSKLN